MKLSFFLLFIPPSFSSIDTNNLIPHKLIPHGYIRAVEGELEKGRIIPKAIYCLVTKFYTNKFKTLKCIRTMGDTNMLSPHLCYIRAICFNSKRNVFYAMDNMKGEDINAWNPETGECFDSLEGNCGKIKYLYFDSERDILYAMGSEGFTAWNLENGIGNFTNLFKRHFSFFRKNSNLCHDAKKNIFYLISSSGTIRKWHADRHQFIRNFRINQKRPKPTCPLLSLCFDSKRDILYSLHNNGEIKKWDAISSQHITTFENSASKRDILYFIRDNGEINMWDAASRQHITTYEDSAYNIPELTPSLCLDSKNNILYSAGEDENIKKWNAETGKLLDLLKGHKKTVYSICFNTKWNILFSFSNDDECIDGGCIKIWDWDDNCINTLKDNHDLFLDVKINDFCFDDEKDILFSSNCHGTIDMWAPSNYINRSPLPQSLPTNVDLGN